MHRYTEEKKELPLSFNELLQKMKENQAIEDEEAEEEETLGELPEDDDIAPPDWEDD